MTVIITYVSRLTNGGEVTEWIKGETEFENMKGCCCCCHAFHDKMKESREIIRWWLDSHEYISLCFSSKLIWYFLCLSESTPFHFLLPSSVAFSRVKHKFVSPFVTCAVTFLAQTSCNWRCIRSVYNSLNNMPSVDEPWTKNFYKIII